MNLFRPPTTQKKCQKFGWDSKPKVGSHPTPGFPPETNSQLRTVWKMPQKNRPTSNPAILVFTHRKRLFENPGGDEKMHGKPGWHPQNVSKSILVYNLGLPNVSWPSVTQILHVRFGSTQKKWPKRTLAKLRWERGYAVEGRLAGSKLGKHHFVAKKKTQQETNPADRGSVEKIWKNWGGFIWGDFVKWQVCVQRWSLVWRQELAVCVRALGNMKAAREACQRHPDASYAEVTGRSTLLHRSEGRCRYTSSVVCGRKGQGGWWYPRTYYDLTWNLEHFFGICKIQV